MVFLLSSMAYFCCEDSKEGVSDPSRNHAPMIVEQSDTFVAVGDTLNLTASASDQDGDSVSYLLIVYGQWHPPDFPETQFEGTTGAFSFYAKITDLPGRTFSFVADDHHGGTDTTTFYVAVNE
jgi:hypothetical protein